MAVAVVIQSVTLQTDGYLHASGTVGGGAAVSCLVNLNQVLELSAVQIQTYIALLLCLAAGNAGQGSQLPLTGLTGTVNF